MLAKAGAGGGGAGSNAESSCSSPSHQQCFRVGASVWDSCHHGSLRGYGTIAAAAEPAEDGMPRWYVDWQGNQGQRRRAIKESSLALPLMRHTHIKAPTALGQSILVVVGTHKGKTGQTVAQVGERLGGGSGG